VDDPKSVQKREIDVSQRRGRRKEGEKRVERAIDRSVRQGHERLGKSPCKVSQKSGKKERISQAVARGETESEGGSFRTFSMKDSLVEHKINKKQGMNRCCALRKIRGDNHGTSLLSPL
jgi:hypothetical protein